MRYFAYGSNMSHSRLKGRVPRSHTHGAHTMYWLVRGSHSYRRYDRKCKSYDL